MQATIHIRGHVQGVFFRATAKEEADKRGLFGWIKNETDGSVSALVQGSEADIQTFIEWCSEGPSAARVTKVEVEWDEKPAKHLKSFDIVHEGC